MTPRPVARASATRSSSASRPTNGHARCTRDLLPDRGTTVMLRSRGGPRT
jgi:hypothetical protein